MNLYSFKDIEILKTWLMVFGPMELSDLNKMCLIINNSTIQYLASPMTGFLKLVSFFARNIIPLFYL